MELQQKKSSKAEQVSVFPLQISVLADKGIFRKVYKEIGRKERYRGCAEEIKQADRRGGSNGCCSAPEGREYDR